MVKPKVPSFLCWGFFIKFVFVTPEQLHKLQEQSRKKYNAPPPEVKPKTMREVLDENFDFIDGELILKERNKKRKEKKIMPDLMAAQITVPYTSDKTTEPKVMNESKKNWPTVHDKPYVPKPVQDKVPFMRKTVEPDPPKQIKERPPAIYTNSASPYGIYDELKKEWK